MNNYPDMVGLDLFTDPFSRQPQAYNQPPVRSSSTIASHPKTAATQTLPNRQAAKPTQPKPVAAQAQQPNTIAKPTTPPESPAPQENVKAPVPVKEQEQKPTAAEPAPAQKQKPVTTEPAPVKESTPVATQPEPKKKTLELDMSTSGKASNEDDAARRKAHEEAEAKRKAAWEAKQAEKRKAEEEALQKLNAMSDDDAIVESIKRVSEDVERLTRRNMKHAVSEHIQELARKNPAFARLTMQPCKNMSRCFRYINRLAKNYVRQEMEENDIKPDSDGYGCDVPDDIVYKWATDYFYDANAPEDDVKEEKFIPKPYVGKTSKPKKTTTKAKKTEKAAAKDTAKNQAPKDDFKQMSLF